MGGYLKVFNRLLRRSGTYYKERQAPTQSESKVEILFVDWFRPANGRDQVLESYFS
jgi:hypothetical protein